MLDIAIIGGGPAGLTAGLYAARAGAKCRLFESVFTGGQAAKTILVENYPGFPDGINGAVLGMSIEQQAKKFGLDIVFEHITGLELGSQVKTLKTEQTQFQAKAVIIATGANPRKLGLTDEEKLTGAGISYCATCDGAFFRNKNVAVVGGGNTAVADALYLAKLASKVYVIHRRNELRADTVLRQSALKDAKIEFVLDSVAVELMSTDNMLSGVKVQNLKTQNIISLDVEGLFVAVGTIPNSDMVKGQIELADTGHIITDLNMKTSLEGVYAAGDVRSSPLKQIITAAADGAVAATKAIEYISGK